MTTDFIPTATRKQGCLTFAMKKRPTSGDVTYIRTLHDDVDVVASSLEGVMVLVVLNILFLYSHCGINKKQHCNTFNDW